MSEVKNVSWRLDRLTEKNQEKVRAYLKSQSNVQKTLEFQALYFQERFGNVDILDYEVQRKLFSDFSATSVVSTPKLEEKEIQQPKNSVVESAQKEEMSFNNNSNNKLENNVNIDDF